MSRILISILVLCISLLANSKQLKVAVIDSGFSPLAFSKAGLKLCKDGHYDFDSEQPIVGLDDIGHGAYVTALIDEEAGNTNVCYVIYKVFGPLVADVPLAIDRALILAYKNKVAAINMSLYMTQYSHKTRNIVKTITEAGIKIFVAAGNQSTNLNVTCLFYPVCYKGLNSNLIVVGAYDMYRSVANYSNVGAIIDLYEQGDLQQARGTSFAAPRALGKWLKEIGK